MCPKSKLHQLISQGYVRDLHMRVVHKWTLFCADCAKDATQHTYSCYIRGISCILLSIDFLMSWMNSTKAWNFERLQKYEPYSHPNYTPWEWCIFSQPFAIIISSDTKLLDLDERMQSGKKKRTTGFLFTRAIHLMKCIDKKELC